jgi:hypothetical protein
MPDASRFVKIIMMVAAFFRGQMMAAEFDRETIERLRSMPAPRALREAQDAVYRAGAVSSDDFQDVYRQLVDEGVLTWEQIEELEG